MPAKLALDKEGRDELVEAVSQMPVAAACDLVGISRDTFYSYVRRGMQGEQPFAGFVRELRGSRAKRIRKLTLRADEMAEDDPGMMRYILGVAMPRTHGREPEGMDFVQEALEGADREEQVALMAGHPDVRAAVLASITDDERKAVKPPKRAKALGKGKAKA